MRVSYRCRARKALARPCGGRIAGGLVLLSALTLGGCAWLRDLNLGGFDSPAATSSSASREKALEYFDMTASDLAVEAARRQVAKGEEEELSVMEPSAPAAEEAGERVAEGGEEEFLVVESSAPEEMPKPSFMASDDIIVRRGDTLYSLASAHEVSVSVLAEANGLSPPYLLKPGQRLILPPAAGGEAEGRIKRRVSRDAPRAGRRARFHTVRRGDTLFALARRYGVTLDALVKLNGLAPPYLLSVGDKLKLPAKAKKVKRVKRRRSSPPAPSVAPRRKEAEGARKATPPPAAKHKVRKGETIYGLARRHGTTIADIVRANRLKGHDIRAGQTLYLPTADAPRRAPVFMWPVLGRVVSGFGVQGGGRRNDGMNIRVKAGTPVRAAADGVVLYAGNDVAGLGGLVVLDHGDDWVSAYAHNRTLVSKRGARVNGGEVIAYVGASGNVRAPQLHFQLRYRNRPLDPRHYLRRRS